MKTLDFARISIEQESETGYDLVLATLGYESRSTSVPEKLNPKADNILAVGFDHNREAAYLANAKWFDGRGIRIRDEISDRDFPKVIEDEIGRILKCNEGLSSPIRIAFDVSCQNRFRIASVLAFALPLVKQGRLILDIWYALAEFQAPDSCFVQNEFVGPVHPRFAGWFRDPGRPIALVAGLGYEQGKVMGATEYVQASKVVAFVPISPIQAYEPDLRHANESLLAELEEKNVIEYSLEDTVGTLATLDSAVRGLEEDHNVVILPLGPKIFSVLALVCQVFHSESSVWRVSSGRHRSPRDIKASGHFYGIRIDGV